MEVISIISFSEKGGKQSEKLINEKLIENFKCLIETKVKGFY